MVIFVSALILSLYCLEDRLVKWAMRKYKHLRGHRRRAAQWLKGIAQKEQSCLLIGGSSMQCAEFLEPYESRDSRTVL